MKAISFFVGVISSIMMALVFQFYWNTFLQPNMLGWAKLHIFSAWGICVLMQIPNASSFVRLLVQGDDSTEANISINLAMIVVYAIIWLIGWLVSLFL